MKVVGKVLGILAAAGAIIAGAAYAWRTLRARKPKREAAGVMFVGAVDEVELGSVDVIDGFDPAEVPSEHSEINELRTKMPLG